MTTSQIQRITLPPELAKFKLVTDQSGNTLLSDGVNQTRVIVGIAPDANEIQEALWRAACRLGEREP